MDTAWAESFARQPLRQLVAFYFGAQGHDVGPDADDMAKDPVLHIDVRDATPGEVHASTGREAASRLRWRTLQAVPSALGR